MGTNYYWSEKPACETCGRDFERKHIGKSSSGWVFALHIYPEDGIRDLDDWAWCFSKGVIRDEYGQSLSAGEMLAVIMIRGRDDGTPSRPDWYVVNHAYPGPRGLARSTLTGNCVRAGAGTWDLHTGEFS